MQTLRFIWRVFALWFLLLGVEAVAFIHPQKAQAQQSAFLITPYYGSHPNPAAGFDHDLPNYTNDNTFERNDGQSWTGNVDKVNCITSVNCYDGHNGYDFGLYYQRVLAAADGTVIEVGWNSLTCGHWGPACAYGLHIKIRHNNNYVTLYGHLSSIAVNLGDYVSAGQIIGTSGDSGNTAGSDQNPTLGAHLHFTVTNDHGYDVDPFGWTGGGADPWNTHNSGNAASWFMWSGGEWAGNPIADPTPTVDPASCSGPVTCIDDNATNSGGFSKGSGGPFNGICTNNCGGWTQQSFTGGQSNLDGLMYSTPANGTSSGDQWARWIPTIPSPGVYELWVYIPNIGATSYQAKYMVQLPDGTTSTAFGVDQYGLNNQWVSLGAHHFLSGSSASVYVTDSTGESSISPQRYVGVDAIKLVKRPSFVSFQPDITVVNGWSSDILIHNNGSISANVYLSVLSGDGSFNCGTDDIALSVAGHATLPYLATCGGEASAVIDSDQDIGVEVENTHANGQGQTDVATNYTGILPAGQGANPDWGQTGATVYAPTVKHTRYGFTSDLYIFNAGTASTNVTVSYYKTDGTPGGALPCNNNINLAPNGQCVVTIPDTWGDNLIFSAKITNSAGQPLAAVAAERNATGSPTSVGTSNLLAVGATTLYVPTIKKQRYNYSTGVRVQNISGTSATVRFTYYDSNSTNTYTSQDYAVPANAAVTVYEDTVLPTNFVGAAKITSLNGQLIVAESNETGLGTAPLMSISGTGWGSPTAYVPHIIKECSGSCNGFVTGLRVQNIGGSTASVTITYYNSTGGNIGSEVLSPTSGRAQNAAQMPIVSIGSATIASTQPIVVVANVANTYDTTKDLQMTYNVPNR